MDGAPLELVNKMKYLGHEVTSDLRDDDDLEREWRALSVPANIIAHRFALCVKENNVIYIVLHQFIYVQLTGKSQPPCI